MRGSPFRRVAGPLLLYHVLLLGGAVLLIGGVIGGYAGPSYLGWILVGGGIAVQLGVLVWASRLIRKQDVAPKSPTPPGTAGTAKYPGARWLCVGCGWKGEGGPRFCPRCGRLTVRIPGPSASSLP